MHRYIYLSILVFCFLSSGTATPGETMTQKNTDNKHPSASSSKNPQAPLPRGIQKAPFGRTKDGREVDIYTLSNERGAKVKITNFGAIVTEIDVPDRTGKSANIVLGFDSFQQYEASHPYFGAIVGRYGNRIAKGKFTLDGKEYRLATNNGPNHLHGGLKGFDKVLWLAEPATGSEGPALKLTLVSPDGDEGYPGKLTTTVVYTLTGNNELKIDYTATTDKTTILNLTSHSYFNLAGPGAGDILNHVLMLAADKYTPVDDTLIPTGEILSVNGTPFDFKQPHSIGSRIGQVKGGYDHNFVLRSGGADRPVLAARVQEPKTGRVMEVLTTQPGIQFYTGNFLDGSLKGNGGVYKQHYGFCLETQHFPDSIHHAGFPSVVLEPGKLYHQVTVYKFSVEN